MAGIDKGSLVSPWLCWQTQGLGYKIRMTGRKRESKSPMGKHQEKHLSCQGNLTYFTGFETKAWPARKAQDRVGKEAQSCAIWTKAWSHAQLSREKTTRVKQRKVNHGLQRATSGLIKILLILVQLNLRMWNSNLLALEKWGQTCLSGNLCVECNTFVAVAPSHSGPGHTHHATQTSGWRRAEEVNAEGSRIYRKRIPPTQSFLGD